MTHYRRKNLENGFSFIVVLILLATVAALGVGVHWYVKAPTGAGGVPKIEREDTQIMPEALTPAEPAQQEEMPKEKHEQTKTGPKPKTVVPQKLPADSPNFENLVREIEILSNAGNQIGPEHFARLQSELTRAAQTGMEPAEIQKLQAMLEKIKVPESHTTQNNQTSPPAPTPIPLTTPPPSNQQQFRNDPEIPSALEMVQIPSCGNQQFVTMPVDMSKVFAITPRGNLGPPGHTFPTEHPFFHLSAGGATTETIPLSSPADVYVTLISFGHGMTQDPVDYTIWFALCKDVIGYYNHVKSLSLQLEEIVAKKGCSFGGETKQTRCSVETLTLIKNAAPMGAVGRLQGNFDFGIFDFRKKLLFANPARYGTRSLYIQCALDYYESSLKLKLYGLLERADQSCGEVAQDVPGTLKGNWFAGNAQADLGTDWNKHLAFVKDNKNPETSVVSIGGTLTDAGKWEFKAQSSGVINREFQDVQPDGTTYCYEASGKSGRILLVMQDAQTLKIEHQQNTCTGELLFNSIKR